MLARVLSFLAGLFSRKPVRLAIVRRYADANGAYVGELYMEQAQHGMSSYRMIGASLDTLPLNWQDNAAHVAFTLDTRRDFLAAMPPNTLRVGALDPRDNESVRRMIGRLPRSRMTLVIQNRFIEHILEPKL